MGVVRDIMQRMTNKDLCPMNGSKCKKSNCRFYGKVVKDCVIYGNGEQMEDKDLTLKDIEKQRRDLRKAEKELKKLKAKGAPTSVIKMVEQLAKMAKDRLDELEEGLKK